ncbi:MAG: hypothetical protein N3E36_03980 [Sulfolobales archaeon]|nr:hypothetical protein [Sulfolobales archaeon]MCX8199173.1 hypothetical protein [Sulfolobales archaeon]MDW8170153.1 hypothetical protein [Desulfurococcaceae archaeon]
MALCVESSARLHLGFYNFYEDGIAYGGLGVAIESPIVRIKVNKCEDFKLVALGDVYLEDVANAVKRKLKVENVCITVEKAIPRNVGLGSTTQIALAIAYGITKLFNLNYSIRELALILKRGKDSGVGIAAFENGGFIVDGGRKINGKVEEPKTLNDIPPVIFQSPLPQNWYFIILIPRGIKGLDELRERYAMDYPRSLPRDLQYELYKLLLLHIIPSVIRGDIKTFGMAVTKLQMIVGTYFSKYQGGVYCCREVEELVKTLLEAGAYGAGQSSWGPTTYGIVEELEKAYVVLKKVLERAYKLNIDLEYLIVKARNRGVQIEYC